MLPKPYVIAIAAFFTLPGAGVFAAVEKTPADIAKSAAAGEGSDVAYTRKLDERVAKIVATLELKDETLSKRLHHLIVAQYRTLNTWHEVNDARLKELKKTASDADAEKAATAKVEIDTVKATLKNLHDNYLAELAKDLPPELIERVKDGMTVGKVQFTYKGYTLEYPALTEEQKSKVLGFLKEAREEAMDAGSMDEKSDIFNRYKGRINNWLSKQGVEAKTKKTKADKPEKAEPAAK